MPIRGGIGEWWVREGGCGGEYVGERRRESIIKELLAPPYGPSRLGKCRESVESLAKWRQFDLRRVDPALLHPADRLVLNDVDPDALQYAPTHLPAATRAQTAAAPGNVLRTAAHLAADHGPFDLVLAGGLFDYLEERFAQALIRTTLSRPGGTFCFSNIATPNLYPP